MDLRNGALTLHMEKTLSVGIVNTCDKAIGLRSHSHSSMLYRELGRMPLQHRWHKQTLRFWNRLLIAENHSLTVPGFCAIVRQCTRTMALLYDSVLWRTKFPIVDFPKLSTERVL
jgi:hypothetical protein